MRRKFTFNISLQIVFATTLLFVIATNSHAQKTKLQVFLNVDNHTEFEGGETSNFFDLGEQDFFITSKITDRFSFIGETVIKPSGTSFVGSIERALIKYDYKGNHSVLLGKMHTPINYWNDVYHHGRLFFPTIDRPEAFSYIIPIHNLGVQFRGQNLGKLNFGYDVVFGNGMSATDAFDLDLRKSISAAVHIKPIDFLRVGVGYYNDFLINNFVGSHVGHSHASHNPAKYTGDLDYHLLTGSIAYFGPKLEILNEFAANFTKTDTLGLAQNFSNYTYLGYRLKDMFTVYGLTDFIIFSDNELHNEPISQSKLGVGLEYEFSPMVILRSQIENYHYYRTPIGSAHSNKWELKFQMCVAF